MVRLIGVLAVAMSLSFAAAASKQPTKSKTTIKSLIGTTIKPGTDYTFNLKRTEVDKALGNITDLLYEAATEPVVDKGGNTTGFKLTYIEPASIFEKIGFTAGDIIKKVNGRKVDGPSAALELFTELRDSSSIKVQIERFGKSSNLTYLIR